jgi:aspartate-semialdehyde dehydrogenase
LPGQPETLAGRCWTFSLSAAFRRTKSSRWRPAAPKALIVSFGDKTLKVQAMENYDFSDTDICLMSAGGSISKEWSPRIGAKGCVVIDNSSAWRYDADVPLIVPEVNADAITGFTKKNIIANPNCSTAQLVVALKPLHDHAKIKRVVVSTYQSVSGGGKDAMEELFNQTRAVFRERPDRAGKIHQADRIQRHSAHRCLHGRRLHQGRMESAGRNQEDA